MCKFLPPNWQSDNQRSAVAIICSHWALFEHIVSFQVPRGWVESLGRDGVVKLALHVSRLMRFGAVESGCTGDPPQDWNGVDIARGSGIDVVSPKVWEEVAKLPGCGQLT